MIIWMGWFVLSISIMAFVGFHRYSLSSRLMTIFIEVSAEEVKAYEFICIVIEVFLVLSVDSTWEYHIFLLTCGIAVLILSQFVLMRIAGKVTSSINRYICEKRLNLIMVSRKIRARMRYAHEFE